MKNILISCVSMFEKHKTVDNDNNPKQPTVYSSEDITISALQTNEACIKFLLKKLARDNKILDTYMRVQSNNVEQDEHTMQYLDGSINDFCSNEGLTAPKNYDFFLREDEKKHRYDRVLSEISSEILRIADGDSEVSIYLDMAGGKRDNYIFIQLLTKLLSFYGFEVHTYYADVAGEIVNTDLSFEHMEILDAINEFVHTGSVASLRRCYENSSNKSVRKLLGAMDDFSTSIQICSTEITDNYHKLGKWIANVDNNLTNDSGGLFMIKAMIPLIREKFGFETDESNFVKDGSPERTILKIIKWCLDHNMIQQALTIYNERIAQIIFDKKLVEIDENVHSVQENDFNCKQGSDKLTYILNDVFKNINDQRSHSRELGDELFKYNDSQNKSNSWKQAIAAYFFEETFLSRGIKLNVDEQIFRKILCDTRFANCARNRVNHASDRNSYGEEIIAMLRQYDPSYSSYKEVNAFKPNNIKKDLISVVENLEEALDLIDNALLAV